MAITALNPPMTAGSGFTTSEVPIGQHMAEISALWRRNLGGMDYDTATVKLRLGYIDNPAGQGVGIVLRDGSSKVETPAGVICVHPRRMHFGSSDVIAANLADYAVEEAYRTLGPALMLMKKALAVSRERMDLIYGLPNAKSAAVCRRAGLTTVGQYHRFARVVSSRHPRVSSLAPRLMGLFAPVLDMAMASVDAIRGLSLEPGMRCESAKFDNPAIDEIWSKRPTGLLLSERSSTMLEWRYGTEGRGNWQLCLMRDRKGEAVGYVVWRLTDHFAEVSDFFSIDPGRLTTALLHQFCRFARRSGAFGVNFRFFGTSSVKDALRKAGISERADTRLVVLGTFTDRGQQLADPELWYLTNFDNDAD